MKDNSRQAARSGKERSQRQPRVRDLLRHALAGVLERDSIRDPDLAGVKLTVTEVRISPDLRNAAAFVIPLGGANTDEAIEALRRAAPYLRRLLAQEVQMKRLPALSFEPDTSFDEAQRINSLLDGSAGGPGNTGDGP